MASNLADNFIERVRANPGAIDNYFPTNNIVLKGLTPSPTQRCNLLSKCNATQLANFDVWEWEQQLLGVLERVGSDNAGGLVNPSFVYRDPPGEEMASTTLAIVWHGQSQLETTAITNANANNCGTAVADNAYDLTGNDNVYRRIHWQEFILMFRIDKNHLAFPRHTPHYFLTQSTGTPS